MKLLVASFVAHMYCTICRIMALVSRYVSYRGEMYRCSPFFLINQTVAYLDYLTYYQRITSLDKLS